MAAMAALLQHSDPAVRAAVQAAASSASAAVGSSEQARGSHM